KLGYLKRSNRKMKQKVLDAIDLDDMGEYAYQNIGKLSGGEQQRVIIARALVSQPELLIRDEPTVGIDYQNAEKFYKLVHQLNKRDHITLFLIRHDTGVLTEYAADVACLNKTMHFQGNTKEFSALSTEYLSEIYGHPVQVIVHDHE